MSDATDSSASASSAGEGQNSNAGAQGSASESKRARRQRMANEKAEHEEGYGGRGKKPKSGIGLRPDQQLVHQRMLTAKSLLRKLGIDTDAETTNHEFDIVVATFPPAPHESVRTV